MCLKLKLTAANDAVAVAPAQARLHPRDTFGRHTLKQPHVEAHFVPFHGRARDLDAVLSKTKTHVSGLKSAMKCKRFEFEII